MTFAEDIEAVAGDEPIEAVVIGEYRWNDYRGIDSKKVCRPITWAEARPLLDYDYDRGFGGVECHSIYAYTATAIIFVVQYDGATYVDKMPRFPCECEPIMPGG